MLYCPMWLIHLAADRLESATARFLCLGSQSGRTAPERRVTLSGLIASAASFVAFAAAT